MRHTTPVSPVSGVALRLARPAERPAGRLPPSAASPPSRTVSLANPLARPRLDVRNPHSYSGAHFVFRAIGISTFPPYGCMCSYNCKKRTARCRCPPHAPSLGLASPVRRDHAPRSGRRLIHELRDAVGPRPVCAATRRLRGGRSGAYCRVTDRRPDDEPLRLQLLPLLRLPLRLLFLTRAARAWNAWPPSEPARHGVCHRRWRECPDDCQDRDLALR